MNFNAFILVAIKKNNACFVIIFLGSASALPSPSKRDWRPDVQSANQGPQRSYIWVSDIIRVSHAGMSEQGLLSVAAWFLFLHGTFLTLSH